MVIKLTSLKLDSNLINSVRLMSIKKEISLDELVASYLISGLKSDTSRELNNIRKLEKELNLNSGKTLNDIDFEIPEMLKYNPNKKELTDFDGLINGDEESQCDLDSIIGIVRSPEPVSYKRG